jgi:hypothetical protein
MPSSYSSSLRLELQFTGENINLWGDKLNSALERIDSAAAGWTAITVSGDYTLTTANGTADEARSAMLKLNGSPAAAFSVTIPPVSKPYFVFNNTSKTSTFTTGAGATVSIGAGDKTLIACDGSAVHTVSFGGYALKDYIDQAILATTGSLPAATGNEDKVLQVQGGAWVPTEINADAAAVRLGTATNRSLTPGDTYNAFAEVTLTSSANSVALDMSTFINGYHDFTENTTFANPTNAKPGQTGYIRTRQHASSAKTGAFGSNWKRSGGSLAFTTTLSAYDFIVYQVITPTYILYDLIRNPS